MHWNFRVTRQELDGEVQYGIREVHYDGDKIIGWTADIIGAAGDTIHEVRMDLIKMLEAAFSKPVIDITDEDNPKEIE